MKKTRIKLNFFIVVLLASFTVSSCLLDDEKTDFGKGPILAQFEKPSITANFIKDGSVTPYNVAITIIGGKNKPLNEPVDITISADPSSTATSGVEYSLAATTFTIPAGEMSVDAVINVNTANLDPFDAKTLVLKIDSSSESVSESNLAAITLQAVCSLDLSGFVGTYTAVNTRFANPLTATVELGPLPNSLLITNAEGYGDDKVLIVLNADVVNPTITYAGDENYYLYNHASYGPVWATTLTPEQSTYNSCDFSLNLEFKRCVSIGCFGGSRVISMTKN